MTRHASILGIDGSGKSTVAQGLPSIVAAQSGLLVGAAGRQFQVSAPNEDLLAGRLATRGRPLSLHLARVFQRLAKRSTRIGWLYAILKLLHMLFQDRAARALGHRYRAELVLSEGNALLCSVGRAMNYLAPASRVGEIARSADMAYLVALLRYFRDGGEAPRGFLKPSWVRGGRWACRALAAVGLDPLWVPEQVVFLDLPVDAALKRISARGAPVDGHENAADMAQARQSYLAGLRAIAIVFPDCEISVISTESMEVAETLATVKQALRLDRVVRSARADETLGTTSDTRGFLKMLARVLNPRYFAYQLKCAGEGAWREPLFALSRIGRQLLAEGYSANTMAAIYARDHQRPTTIEQVFQEYPLHRAVYDRLHILVPQLASLIRGELARKGSVRVFTAPSGHAEDIFRALEVCASTNPEALTRVEVVAADLDPAGTIERTVCERARSLGVTLRFERCDLTSAEGRARLVRHGEFDLALFVGLSSWLPKPAMREHLRWLGGVLPRHGALVTDCFSAAPYAISGALAGYKASYFTPETYQAFVADAGFRAAAAAQGGRDRINHVQVFVPTAERAAVRAA